MRLCAFFFPPDLFILQGYALRTLPFCRFFALEHCSFAPPTVLPNLSLDLWSLATEGTQEFG